VSVTVAALSASRTRTVGRCLAGRRVAAAGCSPNNFETDSASGSLAGSRCQLVNDRRRPLTSTTNTEIIRVISQWSQCTASESDDGTVSAGNHPSSLVLKLD
jgi:hypothetical protein